jgi:hypothetical protein
MPEALIIAARDGIQRCGDQTRQPAARVEHGSMGQDLLSPWCSAC